MKFKDMKHFKCHLGYDFVKNSIMVGDEKIPCLTCGEETEFIDVFSEAHFCSEECLRVLDDEYNDYLKACDEYEKEHGKFERQLETETLNSIFH